ncbi:MAG: hypothetical protein NXI18_08810 [Alphaproteobacteria bacterium]|nr:hypothetical protein [Alphaproteobacteria bacterium]
MTDLQTTMAIVFAVMAVAAAGLVAWGVSGFFDKSGGSAKSDGAETEDAVAAMQRKNLAAKHDHNSQQH